MTEIMPVPRKLQITVLPVGSFPRLVFAESFTTPIASLFKLKCVMLKAARGWILIPEIENENADFLIDNLRIRSND